MAQQGILPRACPNIKATGACGSYGPLQSSQINGARNLVKTVVVMLDAVVVDADDANARWIVSERIANRAGDYHLHRSVEGDGVLVPVAGEHSFNIVRAQQFQQWPALCTRYCRRAIGLQGVRAERWVVQEQHRPCDAPSLGRGEILLQ